MKNDKSWRAMLIKDNEGDWGVCVAVWRGMKKGTPGIPGKISFLILSFMFHFNTIALVIFMMYEHVHFFQESQVQKENLE